MTARSFVRSGPAGAWAAALLGLAACSTVGDRFATAAVNTVANGMTRAQVVSLMDSEPFYVSPDGRRLDFGYVDLVGPNRYRHRVTFLFDADGRTVAIPPGGILGPRGRAYAELVGPQG